MAYQINGVNIPSSIYNSGNYLPPNADVVATNGQNEDVASRIKNVRWSWRSLSKDDFEWWTQTILSNEKSLRCAVRLPNETWVETAYAVAVVRQPTTSGMHAGRYWDVEIWIKLMP